MKTFWFKKHNNKQRYQHTSIGFAVLWFIAFLIFSLVATVKNTVLATPTQTLFENDLEQLALYLSPYDNRAASVLLSMQRIVNGYSQKQWYLKTYRGDIENVLQYVSNNPAAFSQLWIQEFKPFLDFLSKASANKDDIFSLLGSEKPQTYIILLQNAAEKRPNGWFFGSFVKITVFDAHITDMQLIDSYVPGILRPDVTLTAPNRSSAFLSGDNTITFLASNKFWFTNMDGANIKKLYDLTYQDDIRGVIFVNSDLFADLLPWFQEQLREWQFNNAAIDLIRWSNLPNKKELYFNGVKDFLATNWANLAKAVIKNFWYIQDNRHVQVHLVRTSEDLTSFLVDEKLVTNFTTGNMYLRDYNSSYNKIDTFIQKNISIFDDNGGVNNGKLVYDGPEDIVPLATLHPGKYTLNIQYAMNIPQSYIDLMYSFADEYHISLNLREKHILAIIPQRATRGVIYAPQNILFGKVSGPIKTSTHFATPFSNNVFYILENTQNNTIKEITLPFEVR